MNFAEQLHDAETMKIRAGGLCLHQWKTPGAKHKHECGVPVSEHNGQSDDYHDCHFCSVGCETTKKV